MINVKHFINIIQFIFTTPGHVLTLHFLQMRIDRNDSAIVEVYDGMDKLLARVKVRNGTLPQSVTSTSQNLFINFVAESGTDTIVFVRLTSGYSKSREFTRKLRKPGNFDFDLFQKLKIKIFFF